MTFDEKIAFWATVGTCLSALATFWTVLQMKKQRADSFRPDLAFASARFEARSENGGKIPRHWILPPPKGQPQKYERDFVVTLHNLGLGSARNILLEWSFPIEQILEDIKLLAAKKGITSNIRLENGWLFVESETFGQMGSHWEGQKKMILDFVLPASSTEEPVAIALPDVFVFLFSLHIYLASQLPPTTVPRRVEIPDFPPLTVNIQYLDIGGTKHKVAFNFIVHPSVIKKEAVSVIGEVECKRHHV